MRKLFYLAIFLVFLLLGSIVWSVFHMMTGGFPNLGLFAKRSSDSPERLTGQSDEPFLTEPLPSDSAPLDEEKIGNQDEPIQPSPVNSPTQTGAEEPFDLAAELTQLGQSPEETYSDRKAEFLKKLETNRESLGRWINEGPESRDDLLDLMTDEPDIEVKAGLSRILLSLPEPERLEMIRSFSLSPSLENQKVAIELYARESSNEGLPRLREIALDQSRMSDARLYAFQTLFRRQKFSEEEQPFLDRALEDEQDERVQVYLQHLADNWSSMGKEVP